MAKIVITIEGGQIQGITSDDKELEVCVLDFDTDGQDVPKIRTFSEYWKKEPCNIYSEVVGYNKNFINHYFTELKHVKK